MSSLRMGLRKRAIGWGQTKWLLELIKPLAPQGYCVAYSPVCLSPAGVRDRGEKRSR